MAISAPNIIAENSAATPGLWNSIVTQLWANDLSLSGGTFGTSSNTLTPESGNTITVAASQFVTTYLTATTASATPTALAASQSFGFLSTVYGATLMGFGTTADVTLMNRAGTPVVAISPNSTILLLNNMEAFYATTGLAPTVVSTTGRNGVFFGTVASVRINGTLTAPTAATNGGTLGAYACGGYDGSTVTAVAGLFGVATETWAAGAHGARLLLRTIPTGGTTSRDALALAADGSAMFFGNVAGGSGSVATFGQYSFTISLISTTALSTPSTLTATQFTGYANVTDGAAVMGYGSASDVTLVNRAGNAVLLVLANTLNVEMKGTLLVASNITQSAGTAALQAVTATTLNLSGLFTSTVAGQYLLNSAGGTGVLYYQLVSTGGQAFVGLEDSAGNNIASGTTGYALVLNSVVAKALELATTNTVRLSIAAGGAFDFKSNALSGIANLTQASGTAALQAVTCTTLIGSDATDATNSTSGAFKTAGGMGVAKKLYVGTNADAATYSVAGTAGADGTGTVISAITVTKGIVTAITVA